MRFLPAAPVTKISGENGYPILPHFPVYIGFEPGTGKNTPDFDNSRGSDQDAVECHFTVPFLSPFLDRRYHAFGPFQLLSAPD